MSREGEAGPTAPADPHLAAEDEPSLLPEDPEHRIALWEQLIGGMREIQETLENLNNLNHSPVFRDALHRADAAGLETRLAHFPRRLEYLQVPRDTR